MKTNGQALIETAVITPLIVLILAATVAFAQWLLIRQRLVIATREAAMLYSSGRMNSAEVQKWVKRYAARSRPLMSPEDIDIRTGRQSGWEAQLHHLDLIVVRYRCPVWLGRYFEPVMEEKCVIKHAPHYGPPIQTLYGPPIPW
jgi:hypothetical protein